MIVLRDDEERECHLICRPLTVVVNHGWRLTLIISMQEAQIQSAMWNRVIHSVDSAI